MKVFIVSFVLAVVVLLNVQADSALKDAETKDQCIKAANVKPDAIEKINKGDFENPSKELKKYTYCYFHKTGIVNDDESLNIDTAVEQLPADVSKATGRSVLESCKDKKGETAEDTVYEMFKCFHGDSRIKSADTPL